MSYKDIDIGRERRRSDQMVQLSLLPIPRIVDYAKLVIQFHSGPTTCLWPTHSGMEHICNQLSLTRFGLQKKGHVLPTKEKD